MIAFDSKSGNASFSKYGFVDSDGEITSAYTFSYSFNLNQSLARSAGYVNGNTLGLDFCFSNGDSDGKFVYLLNSSYLTTALSIEYNNVTTNYVISDSSESCVSFSTEISNITESDNEALVANLALEYVTENSTKIKAYFEGLPSDTDFSFKLSIEAKKQS